MLNETASRWFFTFDTLLFENSTMVGQQAGVVKGSLSIFVDRLSKSNLLSVKDRAGIWPNTLKKGDMLWEDYTIR
jgi:hypothetical protein